MRFSIQGLSIYLLTMTVGMFSIVTDLQAQSDNEKAAVEGLQRSQKGIARAMNQWRKGGKAFRGPAWQSRLILQKGDRISKKTSKDGHYTFYEITRVINETGKTYQSLSIKVDTKTGAIIGFATHSPAHTSTHNIRIKGKVVAIKKDNPERNIFYHPALVKVGSYTMQAVHPKFNKTIYEYQLNFVSNSNEEANKKFYDSYPQDAAGSLGEKDRKKLTTMIQTVRENSKKIVQKDPTISDIFDSFSDLGPLQLKTERAHGTGLPISGTPEEGTPTDNQKSEEGKLNLRPSKF